MGSQEFIRISRSETEAQSVDERLDAVKAIQRGRYTEPPELSRLRAILYSKMFYLTIAGALGAVVAWLLIEPIFLDTEQIGGEINLIQDDPFFRLEGAKDSLQFTVGRIDVVAISGQTQLEPGLDGQPAPASLNDLLPGATIEVAGAALDQTTVLALAIRPATQEQAALTGQEIKGDYDWGGFLLFPLTAILIVLFIVLVDGLVARHYRRAISRITLGIPLTFVFAGLAMIPAGLVMMLVQTVMMSSNTSDLIISAKGFPPELLLAHIAARSIAWLFVGIGIGLGMNIIRSTKLQLRNAVLGGALGGAFGGMFFDPIDRFFTSASPFAGEDLSRFVGLLMVGAGVGFFVALAEHMAREAWVLVRTGPLAGKSFILFKTPTLIGSSTDADIYLFKDAGIDPEQVALHKIGNTYDLENIGARNPTVVNGAEIRRHRLKSGDQIRVGETILEFEERVPRESQ